ncbi:MAG: HAD-IC family P-type ATPase, partial [Pseudomonadota bacterium]
VPDAALAEAAALARHSTHPISRAVVRAAEARALSIPAAQDIQEVPGRGVSGTVNSDRIFLGMATKGEGLTVERKGEQATPLIVKESLRPGAAELVQQLSSRGVAVSILSGDRPAAVGAVAQKLGVSDWRGGASAHDKIAHCVALQKNGARVLMVGDGFNDGPALSAADVSMAPAEASDLSRAAADIVLTGHDLSDAYDALNTARRAHRLILQNFMIAAGYNSVAIPLAVLGYATPLLAALAMSTSSILVTLNALRLTERRHTATASPLPAAVASPNTAPSPNTGASPNTVRRPSTVSLSPLAQAPSQGAAPT